MPARSPRPRLLPRSRTLTSRVYGSLTGLLVTAALVLVAGMNPVATHASDGVAAFRAQGVSLQVLPPIRQPGHRPVGAAGVLTVVTATVSPVQAGRTVTLQRRGQQGWRNAATLSTDGAGLAEFFVPTTGGGAFYRVLAQPFRGLVQTRSAAVASDVWGAPVFDEEFAGNTLRSAWEHRIQFYNPWGGRACSKGSPVGVRVAGGALQLSSLPDPEVSGSTCSAVDEDGDALGSFPYRLNGHISTQHSMDFLYGVAAARMRFSRDPGAHAAFWLQPRGLLDTGPTSWGAEIDVIEWYGHEGSRDRMSSAVHAPLPSGEKVQFGGPVARPSRFLATRSDAWWRNYHVFSVEWTPTEYVFRIGGHEVWRTDQGVSHDPEFLILSMLSSDFELPKLGARQAFAQTASVDWVRVWQTAPGTTT